VTTALAIIAVFVVAPLLLARFIAAGSGSGNPPNQSD
jgi:hypothetical protein